jgi:hypothetical protein
MNRPRLTRADYRAELERRLTWKELEARLMKREWHGPGFLWFPIGFGWNLDFEWRTDRDHGETMHALTVKLVKPDEKCV